MKKPTTQTDRTVRKVRYAAGAGTPIGGAIGTIVVYAIETAAVIDLPMGVEGAVVTLTAALAAWLFGYRVHPDINDQPVQV